MFQLKKLVNRIIISLLWRFFPGRLEDQSFLESINKNVLLLLNIGKGANPVHSGEIHLLNKLQLKLSNNSKNIVFDVGANSGEYSLLLLRHLNPIELHVFEPHLAVYEKLKLHLSESDCIINNLGFSNQICTKKLFFDGENLLLSSVYKRQLLNSDYRLNESIQANFVTIDNYCLENSIDSIYFLKMDVEGHELSVLQGAEKMLKSHKIQFVQFEFGGCNIDSKTFLKDFFEILKDYRIFRVLADGLFEIKNYSETEERFHTTNFLAQLK